MPKKKFPVSNSGLPIDPPSYLSASEKGVYTRLRKQIVDGGIDSTTGVETLIVAASQIARLERVAKEVKKLKELTVETSTGQLTIHPLVKELRAIEGAVKISLGQLLLTPRSKTVSRIPPPAEKYSAEDDSILQLLMENAEPDSEESNQAV